MNSETRRKLLLVTRLARDPDPAMAERAADVAVRLGLDVIVYCPVVTDNPETEALARRHVDRIAAMLAGRELHAESFADACVSELDGVTALAATSEAALVMVDSDQYEDWSESLIQAARPERFDAPLWIYARAEAPSPQDIVLAAVAGSGDEVIAQARRLGDAFSADVHVLHIVPDPSALELASAVIGGTDSVAARTERIETGHVARIHEAAQHWNIPPEHVHFDRGDIAQSIGDLAEAMQAAIVVLGSGHRPLLAQLFESGKERKLARKAHSDIVVINSA